MAHSIAYALGLAISHKFANPELTALIRSAADKINQESKGCRQYGSFMAGFFVGRKWTKQIDRNFAHDNAFCPMSSHEILEFYDRWYATEMENMSDENLAAYQGWECDWFPAHIWWSCTTPAGHIPIGGVLVLDGACGKQAV